MRTLISIMVLLLLSKNIIPQNGLAKNAKPFLINNCLSCHSLTKYQEGMQPLQHIRELRRKEYVYQFVLNSAKLIMSGNKTAVKVWNDAHRSPMNLFPQLTKQDIDAICDYIDKFPLPKKK